MTLKWKRERSMLHIHKETNKMVWLVSVLRSVGVVKIVLNGFLHRIILKAYVADMVRLHYLLKKVNHTT